MHDDILKIYPLNQKIGYLDNVNTILYDWWGKERGWSKDEMHQFVSQNITNTWVAITNDELVGICQLLDNDLTIDTSFTPWLANLYITENNRNKGYARVLINYIIETCGKLGHSHLYLHSKHKNLYQKLGFQLIEMLDISNVTKYIYCKKL